MKNLNERTIKLVEAVIEEKRLTSTYETLKMMEPTIEAAIVMTLKGENLTLEGVLKMVQAEREVATDKEENKLIKNLNGTYDELVEKIRLNCFGLAKSFVEFMKSENNSVGPQSIEAHTAQMVPTGLRKKFLNLAGFTGVSEKVKYVSPIKKGVLKLKLHNTKEELLTVAHTSNSMIGKVKSAIDSCDLNNPENLAKIFEDIDKIERTAIELIIDACKNGYKVSKILDFGIGIIVRLASMMGVISNGDDFLNNLNEFRRGKIGENQFSYELSLNHVPRDLDVDNAKDLIEIRKEGEDKVIKIIPDTMYKLQKEAIEVYEEFINKTFKTVFGKAQADKYDSELLKQKSLEPIAKDIIEIIKRGYSNSESEGIEKRRAFENKKITEFELASYMSQKDRFSDSLGNTLFLMLRNYSKENAALIAKAASLSRFINKTSSVEFDNNANSSMCLNIVPSLEKYRAFCKARDIKTKIGKKVYCALKVDGPGVRNLKEGDELVFQHGIATNVDGVYTQLLGNKNDLNSAKSDNIQDRKIDSRLYSGTLTFHIDEKGRKLAVEELTDEHFEFPEVNENKILVRVRSTHENDTNLTFRDVAKDYLRNPELVSVELLPHAILTNKNTGNKHRIKNAIVAHFEKEDEIIGSYSCETREYERLLNGAKGNVRMTRLLCGTNQRTGEKDVKSLFFELNVTSQEPMQSAFDKEDSYEEVNNEVSNEIADMISNELSFDKDDTQEEIKTVTRRKIGAKKEAEKKVDNVRKVTRKGFGAKVTKQEEKTESIETLNSKTTEPKKQASKKTEPKKASNGLRNRRSAVQKSQSMEQEAINMMTVFDMD